MKECSNPDCPTKGLLPDSAFYNYYNKAKGRMVLTSYCRPCERERKGRYQVKQKASPSPSDDMGAMLQRRWI